MEGDKAYESIIELLKQGTADNLFNLHPPGIFQIDGNLGSTAGIIEMLLQSYVDRIHLLPALPSAWKQGSFSGMRTRGGFEIDLHWSNHEVHTVTIHSHCGQICRLWSTTRLEQEGLEAEASTFHERAGYLVQFSTVRGMTYTFSKYKVNH